MTIMSNFASSFANFDIPNWFGSQHLTGMLRGIEKEGLRVRPDGFLAQTPHPAKLGSKLTHPFITTDYSESLLELITEPKASPKETLNMLRQLQCTCKLRIIVDPSPGFAPLESQWRHSQHFY